MRNYCSSRFFWNKGHAGRRIAIDPISFELPLNLQTSEEPKCNIAKHSAIAKVSVASKFITWDKSTKANKRELEAMQRTMEDVRKNSRYFEGAMILLSGDFCKTLPVVPRSTAADKINAYLKSSTLRVICIET
ncbi:uncharacterized protein [Diabrotica undecimpunctata]|uniref:uncharacterized protein n=1 Tax=Diabrotica undecimpunctata TaxID=50387 RepID=UPI003B63BD71